MPYSPAIAKAEQGICAPYHQAPEFAENSEQSLNFIVAGDTGMAGERRDKALRALSDIASETQLSFAILLGDNFYPTGIQSLHDPRWNTDFEQLFKLADFNMPFYSVLGNHDYAGNIQAQIDYSQISKRWKMPSRYYAVRREISPGSPQTLLMLMLDTEVLRTDRGMRSDQYKWIVAELTRTPSTFVVLVGHHPVYSNGRHGGEATLKKMLAKLSKVHKIDLYINGHEHDFQIIKPKGNTVFVSDGGFSKERPVQCGPSSIFASNQSVALLIKVTPRYMALISVNINGKPGFEYRISQQM